MQVRYKRHWEKHIIVVVHVSRCTGVQTCEFPVRARNLQSDENRWKVLRAHHQFNELYITHCALAHRPIVYSILSWFGVYTCTRVLNIYDEGTRILV